MNNFERLLENSNVLSGWRPDRKIVLKKDDEGFWRAYFKDTGKLVNDYYVEKDLDLMKHVISNIIPSSQIEVQH